MNDFELTDEDGIVRVRAQGPLTPERGTAIMSASIGRALDVGIWLILVDFRGATIEESIASLDNRPEFALRLGLSPRARVAMLCTQRDRYFDFIENSFVTKGIRLSLFTSEPDALKWLRSKDTTGRR